MDHCNYQNLAYDSLINYSKILVAQDRLWRKNRVLNSGNCFGVDLNRNFEIGFGGPGSSNAPCSETYRGQFAFSERESQGIRNVMDNVGSRVKAAISVHSYSQLWMSPYSYTTEESADYLEQVVTIIQLIIFQSSYDNHG